MAEIQDTSLRDRGNRAYPDGGRLDNLIIIRYCNAVKRYTFLEDKPPEYKATRFTMAWEQRLKLLDLIREMEAKWPDLKEHTC